MTSHLHVTPLRSGPTARTTTASGQDLLRLMRRVAQPVVVVTGRDAEGQPRGMTVSSFTSVSLDPPLVLFCAARRSTTWAALAPAGEFAVNVVTEDQEGLADMFAVRRTDVSTPALTWPADGGLPVLAEAMSIAHCTVQAVHPGGDHHIVVAAVDHVVHSGSGRPLSHSGGRYARSCRLPES